MIRDFVVSTMPRSALIAWGNEPGPEVAAIERLVSGERRVVTWPEWIERRRSQSTVTRFLAGQAMPEAETMLRIFQWCMQQEGV